MGAILIAEDDVDLRTIVQDFLNASGFSTLTASNGEEAIAVTERQRPELLILDIAMPVVDGWEVVRRLRMQPDFRSLPIIAFTAHAIKGAEDKALAAGCDAYVTKPFSTAHLLSEVKRLLRRPV